MRFLKLLRCRGPAPPRLLRPQMRFLKLCSARRCAFSNSCVAEDQHYLDFCARRCAFSNSCSARRCAFSNSCRAEVGQHFGPTGCIHARGSAFQFPTAHATGATFDSLCVSRVRVGCTRKATTIEVHEHGRWRFSRSSMDMPTLYLEWTSVDRISVTLLCM
jgi:hypothetical protein